MPELPTHRLMTHPLQLVGVCPPLARLTLLSQHITFAYRLRSIECTFGPSTDFLVEVYPFLCFDSSTPTAAPPPGTPLLTWLSPNPYLLGDDTVITLPMDLTVPRRGSWLKAHLVNSDAFPHTISLLMTLQELEVP